MKSTLFALLLCLAASTASADKRPNIILIVANDLGRDWVSCYGAQHQTPNVDRLAQQGVRYETAWCTPIGTSSRVTLLTGQYPFRHGRTQHDATIGHDLSWAKFTTFARVLRDAGYATAIGGKFRINPSEEQPDAMKQHGFDEHCVFAANDSRRSDTKEAPWSGRIVTNGRSETVNNSPDAVNAFLIDFISRSRANPFLVYYPMLVPHESLTTKPQDKRDPSKSKEIIFAESVAHMDLLVGKLIDAVDNTGLGRNTLIVFTSGNGSAVSGTLNGKPFAEGKGHRSDRGVHVPFVVRAPFLTRGGRVSRDLIDFTDLYPTFLDLAKIDRPEDVKLDGRSFVPSLRGSEDPFEKRNWIFSQHGDFRMIRDWQHILDSEGNFHDLTKDPLQQSEVSPLDKIAPGRRQRLEMILKRFPKDESSPN